MIPETRVSAQENLVKLHKRGRMLVASYEAIQFQRLDLFSVTLRQIGAYINRMHVADAIDVICNGDGNKNGADQYTVGTKKAPVPCSILQGQKRQLLRCHPAWRSICAHSAHSNKCRHVVTACSPPSPLLAPGRVRFALPGPFHRLTLYRAHTARGSLGKARSCVLFPFLGLCP